MNTINSNYKINPLKIVIFGAGKIGRSFIGQLFGTNGYQVVFVDVDQRTVDLIQKRKEYRVVIKGDEDSEIVVRNVEAISGLDTGKVASAVASAGIVAASVGKNALGKVALVIAAGLKIRQQQHPDSPLDIILAENMRDASGFLRAKLVRNLPLNYRLDDLVGLVETSIGKMVPLIPLAELEKDPLVVFAEPYNTLIVDKKGFKAAIPDIPGLAPKENIKAWVDCKSFIHNLGHATAAYYGFYKHPTANYIFEILSDPDVYQYTRATMFQSAEIIRLVYSNDFSLNDLTLHIDDLLSRFMNKALKDTIFRVGQDLIRKLGPDDRFMGAIHLAQKVGMPYDQIIHAMSYGFFFRAKDESGNQLQSDIDLVQSLSSDFNRTLIYKLGFHITQDLSTSKQLKRHFEEIEISQHSGIK